MGGIWLFCAVCQKPEVAILDLKIPSKVDFWPLEIIPVLKTPLLAISRCLVNNKRRHHEFKNGVQGRFPVSGHHSNSESIHIVWYLVTLYCFPETRGRHLRF